MVAPSHYFEFIFVLILLLKHILLCVFDKKFVCNLTSSRNKLSRYNYTHSYLCNSHTQQIILYFFSFFLILIRLSLNPKQFLVAVKARFILIIELEFLVFSQTIRALLKVKAYWNPFIDFIESYKDYLHLLKNVNF